MAVGMMVLDLTARVQYMAPVNPHTLALCRESWAFYDGSPVAYVVERVNDIFPIILRVHGQWWIVPPHAQRRDVLPTLPMHAMETFDAALMAVRLGAV